MLSMFKTKNPYAQAAHDVYAQCLSHARQPVFYQDLAVPDTFDGRFDLLLLHVYLILQRMLDENEIEAEAFNQALFDEIFKDMDQTLREMGIGDMGVPKHMRKMMKAFNGRMHAYAEAMEQGDLKEALRKNLYGTVDDVDDSVLVKMVDEADRMLSVLKTQPIESISGGQIKFDEGAV